MTSSDKMYLVRTREGGSCHLLLFILLLGICVSIDLSLLCLLLFIYFNFINSQSSSVMFTCMSIMVADKKLILELHDGRWGSVQDWKVDAGARSTATNTKTWEPVHKLFDNF